MKKWTSPELIHASFNKESVITTSSEYTEAMNTWQENNKASTTVSMAEFSALLSFDK